jgi:nicotinate-nucleotide adenylyltransferase
MGGTFNPIHLGHLIAANEIIYLLELDQVLMVPCALPPHKGHLELIDPSHRLAMASLATGSNHKLTVSSVEIERGGVSYSIDTIRTLQESSPQELQLYFIVGVDVFWDIASWKEVDKLLTLCHFVVTNRPGYDEQRLLDRLTRQVTSRYPHLKFSLKAGDIRGRIHEVSVEGSPYSIYLAHIPTLNISSTEIRRRVAEGRPIDYLVLPEVARYITEHNLYTSR